MCDTQVVVGWPEGPVWWGLQLCMVGLPYQSGNPGSPGVKGLVLHLTVLVDSGNFKKWSLPGRGLLSLGLPLEGNVGTWSLLLSIFASWPRGEGTFVLPFIVAMMTVSLQIQKQWDQLTNHGAKSPNCYPKWTFSLGRLFPLGICCSNRKVTNTEVPRKKQEISGLCHFWVHDSDYCCGNKP